MKKITFIVLAFFAFTLNAIAQHSFDPVAGPTNVAQGTPVTLNINDAGNTAAAPASSTGTYLSFSITAEWVAGGGGPWSSEADLEVVTSGGSVFIDPPTTGGASSGAATTLTFDGNFASLYDPTTDGALDITLNQSYGGSDADWSNIVVTIFESPSCVEPSGMVSANNTSTSADLSWVAGDVETMWNLEWNADTDFTPGNMEEDGSTSVSASPIYSPSGLTPDSTYYVYYQADCGGSDASDWVGPVTFLTGYCDSVPSSNDGSGITNVVLGSASFAGTDVTYLDFTGTTVDLAQSVTANLQITFATGYTYGTNVWIDFNNDLVFDNTTELVYQGTSTNVNPTTLDASFLMPAAALGVYRLRIGTADFGQATPNPCFSGSYGVTVDMSINLTAPPECIPPSGLTASNIGGTSADISWTANNGETEWEYVIQPAGTGVPTTAGTVVSTTTVNLTGLDYSTDYEVYVRANCGTGYSTWSGPLNFSTAIQTDFTVDCNAGPINMTYCYVNNDTNVFVFTSSDGTSLNFTINSGQVENNWDELVIYDSDGVTELTPPDFYGNGGDVSGVNYQSSGDTISFTVTSDGSFSCNSNGYTPIDVTVACATCVNPEAAFNLVNDCSNGEQFLVDVDLTSLGDASSITISDDFGSAPVQVTAVGITQFGPYPNGTDVVISVANTDDSNCTIVSNNLNIPFCGDTCTSATSIMCGDSVSGSTVGATDIDEPADFCGTGGGAPGVWYEFTGTGDIVTMSLCNSSYDTKIQVWEGDDCSALTCVTGNDDACGLQSEALFLSAVDTTYYVYVFGFGSSTGDYILDVTCVEPPPPPPNDDCETPTTLIANADDTCTEFASGTVFGATGSGQANGCDGSADDDVWFEFEAVSTDHAVTINNATGGLSFGVYEGDDCNNLTELYCSPFFGDPTIVANGLTVGNTYLVRVYSSTANPLQDITFDICVFTIPPPIYTSTTDYTVDEIIRDVLANENPDCPQIYNITYSTGTDFGDPDGNGIGYFEANGSAWPFGAGLIMTTGNVDNAPGPEDETLGDGSFLWPGDTELEDQIPGLNSGDSYNASIIEFDFVPIIQHMSFDFIFAAEEYGTFQCGYSDSFAFILTDSNGVTSNLAFVPGTVDPISVFTVRDEQYNGSCPSVNPEYFDKFYGDGGENPLTSPTDFRGHTVIMTAEADVNPGEQYHIKLVIADALDNIFDSAVFIGAGTFDIGYPDLGEDILIGSGQETCEGNPLTIDCGEIPIGAMVEWFMDGELIEGENSQTIQVTETAFYGAEFSYPNGECELYDEVLIEFYENPEPVPVADTVIRCVGLEVTLEVTVSNSDILDTMTYYWTYDGIDIQVGPDNTYTIDAESDELGQFIVTAIDERGCYGDTIINVVEGVYPVVEAVDALVDKCINEDVTLEAVVTNAESLSDNITYVWLIDGMEMQSSTDNTYVHAAGESEAIVTVMARDEVSQCSDETDISVVYYQNANCVDLPQGLSPNGDGDNDCLILDHLEDKENITHIDIFNRHGIKIYELNEYIDQWCGTDQDGNKMPVGTYFYVIYTDAKEPRTSWIYLNY